MQICLYHLSASNKGVMPWLGEIKNSTKDRKYILQKTTTLLYVNHLSTVNTHFSWVVVCFAEIVSSFCGFFSTVSTNE